MAIPHAKPGTPINVRPLDKKLPGTQTNTLIKTDSMEVIRLVLAAGKEIAQHMVPGEITLQCLEGEVAVRTPTATCELKPGDLTYLPGAEEHSVRAEEDSSVLLTILLRPSHS